MKILRLAVFALCTVCGLAHPLQAQQYYWTGNGSDDLFSNPDNWFDGLAPNQGGLQELTFNGGGGVAINDIPAVDGTYAAIRFSDVDFTVNGDLLAPLTNIGFNTGAAGSVTFNAPIQTAQFIFLEFGFASGTQQTMEFTENIALDTALFSYGDATLASTIRLGGGNGSISSAAAAGLRLRSLTLELDNSVAANADRISDSINIEGDLGLRIQLIGNASAAAPLTESITTVGAEGSLVLDVKNNGSMFGTALEVQNLNLETSGLVLSRSSGEAGEVLGSVDVGPKVFIGGQADSNFLGAQQFYLSGNLAITDVPRGNVEYAAYDATRGVISATNNTNDLINGNGSSNVLQTLDIADFNDTGISINSLAFNAENFSGTGKLGLTHLLATRSATIEVGLDFAGSPDASITSEFWNAFDFPVLSLQGTISGNGTLTFRGYGEVDVLAAADFSGAVSIQGGYVNLGDVDGSFNQASSIQIGSNFSTFSSLQLFAGNNNRLGDTAAITMAGGSELTLFSDFGGVDAVSETVGPVTVESGYARISVIGSDSHNPLTPAVLTLSSFAFDATTSQATTTFDVQGENNMIVIEGSTIVLENGNRLDFQLSGGTSIDTPGVFIAEGGDEFSGYVDIVAYGESTLNGNFDLGSGQLRLSALDHGDLTLVGNITLGADVDTVLTLDLPNAMQPLMSIEGDLTLDGVLLVSQSNFFFEEGPWLLFEVTGAITDNGWIVLGNDGNEYDYGVLGNQVFITGIPEPTVGLLVVLGTSLAFLRRRRMAA